MMRRLLGIQIPPSETYRIHVDINSKGIFIARADSIAPPLKLGMDAHLRFTVEEDGRIVIDWSVVS